MKFTRIAAAGLLAIFAGTDLATAETLNVSSWLPPSHAVTKALMEWGQEVKSKTDGRVSLRLLPKPVASPPGTFDAVRDGLADISFTVHGYMPGRFILTQAIELPLLGDTSDVMSVAYQRIHDRYLAAAKEDEGVKTIAVFAHGAGDIYMTKKPVRAISELAGKKLRAGGGMVAEVTKVLEINSVLAPATEIYELLNNGVVDGTVGSPDGVLAFKFAPLIKYYTHVPGGLYNSSFGVFMNPAKYGKLRPADQKTIDELSGEYLAAIIGKHWSESDRTGIDLLRKAGAEFIVADAKFLADLKAKTAPLEKAWIAAAEQKGVDGNKVLESLRAEIAKLQAKN